MSTLATESGKEAEAVSLKSMDDLLRKVYQPSLDEVRATPPVKHWCYDLSPGMMAQHFYAMLEEAGR